MTKRNEPWWSLGGAVRAALGTARSFLSQEPEPAALGPFPGPVPLQVGSEIIGTLPDDVLQHVAECLPHGEARSRFALVSAKMAQVVRRAQPCCAIGPDLAFVKFLTENAHESYFDEPQVCYARTTEALFGVEMPTIRFWRESEEVFVARVRAGAEQLQELGASLSQIKAGDDVPVDKLHCGGAVNWDPAIIEEGLIKSCTVKEVDKDGAVLDIVLDETVDDVESLMLDIEWEHVEREGYNEEWERRMKKTDPEGVCFADGDVPSDLVEALQSGVDKLAARPEKDYHPGSDDVVLDHVHPALYPFIKGTSEFVPSDDLKKEDASGDPRGSVDGAEKLINEPNSGRWGRTYENSIYQWLPTYFDISANGKVSIRGDINNLRPRDEHQGLYESLGLLFEQFVPDLEAVLSYADLITFPDEDFDPYNLPFDVIHLRQVIHQRRVEMEKRLAGQALHVEVKHRLAGQALQVIPKIVDYELKPGQSYEGVWHVEGMSHENIIATCLYILDRDDAIEGGHLLFKRAFTAEDGMILAENMPQMRDPMTQRFLNDGMVPLGQVQTPRGRRVVFPNSHVHRVAKMTNTGSALARRRIIAFFVVDPLVRIVSTQECPDQRSKLSLEAAKEHRLELMRERRLHKQDWNVRDLNLCEH